MTCLQEYFSVDRCFSKDRIGSFHVVNSRSTHVQKHHDSWITYCITNSGMRRGEPSGRPRATVLMCCCSTSPSRCVAAADLLVGRGEERNQEVLGASGSTGRRFWAQGGGARLEL